MTGTILGGFTGRAVSGIVAADVSWQAAFVVARDPDRRRRRGADDVAAARAGTRDSGASARTGRGSFGHLVRNRRLVATCGVGFSVLFTQVAMFTYVTFHLAAPPYSLSTVALGWLFVVYLVGAVVTPFAGHWIDRYGHRAGIASAMAIGGAGALLTLVPWLPAIVARARALRHRRLHRAGDDQQLHRRGDDERSRAGGRDVFDVLLRGRQRRRRAAVAVLGAPAAGPRASALVVLVQTGRRRDRVHAVVAGAGAPRRRLTRLTRAS